jgi:hypothetical protein
MHRYIFFLILGIDAIILFSQTSQVSISAAEASLLYGDVSFLQILIKTSLHLFGQNDFALRFVIVLLHVMSVVLMYLISRKYILQERNRLWLLLMFVLLPGVVSSAIVISSASIIIFGLLLYIYLHDRAPQYLLNSILLFYAIVEVGFVYLFLGVAIYYLFQKNKMLFAYNILLYFLSSFLYGFDAVGYPSGHFLDILGVYSAIFTPIIFIYIFYTLYRRYLTNKTDIIWYISSTALIFSLLLSFRQSIHIENFAPYLIIALPLAAQTFISSYRVRLKQHRHKYKIVFIVSFIFLLLNSFAVFFNKDLYLLIENPKKHFAYDMHIAKELADKLKDLNISCIDTHLKMQKRLRFYEIDYCQNNKLKELPFDSDVDTNVTISYKNRILYKANVTNINKE